MLVRKSCLLEISATMHWLLLGVSGKSVLLYAIVFLCRYLDLFTHFVSVYNSVMKIIYLVSTFFTLYLIYRKFKPTYDRNHDTFRIEFLILPSAVLALLWNHEFSVLEVSRCTFAANEVVYVKMSSRLGSMDVLDLFGIGGHSATVVHGEQNR